MLIQSSKLQSFDTTESTKGLAPGGDTYSDPRNIGICLSDVSTTHARKCVQQVIADLVQWFGSGCERLR